MRPLLITAALTLVLTASLWAHGWDIPPGAEREQIPFLITPEILSIGRSAFEAQCQRCHGPTGHGDGPDLDPQYVNADLTDIWRAGLNPGGVVYYRILNGKLLGATVPRTHSFRGRLTSEQIWSVVAYARSLRIP